MLTLGVDPVGSILARPETLNVMQEGDSPIYKVEGTGYDFVHSFLHIFLHGRVTMASSFSRWLTILLPTLQVPKALDHSVVTHWIKTRDAGSFETCRRLIRNGLMVGGSSGASVFAALEFLKTDEGWEKIGRHEGKNVVIVLPDS